MTIAVTHTGSGTGSTTGGTTLTSVASGARLLLAIAQSGNQLRTYAVSDTVNGAWSELVTPNDQVGRVCTIFGITSAAGSPVITITPSSATAFVFGVVGVTGLSSTLSSSSEFDNPDSNPMYSAAATGFSVPAGGLALCAVAPNASITSETLDPNYTILISRPATSPSGCVGYRIAGGTLTNERMSWLGGTTTRIGPGVSASWAEAAAPPAASTQSNLLTLGVG